MTETLNLKPGPDAGLLRLAEMMREHAIVLLDSKHMLADADKVDPHKSMPLMSSEYELSERDMLEANEPMADFVRPLIQGLMACVAMRWRGKAKALVHACAVNKNFGRVTLSVKLAVVAP